MPMKLLCRITKVDEAKREAWGRATEEIADRQGEVFDFATSRPYFDAWSALFDKATDGKSLGNVRAMHGKVAAGRVIAYLPNEAERAIDIGVHVVDAAEWEKVALGVYTGFSIGGDYIKQWKDETNPRLTRFTARPSEISLVDFPAVPSATFAFVKVDGAQELREFANTVEKATLAQIWACGILVHDHATKAEASVCVKMTTSKLLAGDYVADVRQSFADTLGLTLEKISERKDVNAKAGDEKYGSVAFADPKNKKYPIDTVPHIRAAWNFIHKPKNADKYSAEDVKAIKAKIVAAWKRKIDAKGPPSAKVAAAGTLMKSLYAVGSLAQLLCSVAGMVTDAEWEQMSEGDASTVADQLRAWLQQGGKIMLAMTDEEVGELLTAAGIEDDDDDEDAEALEPMAAAAALRARMQKGAIPDDELLALLRKAGRKFSAGTKKKLKAVHDKVKSMGDGAGELDQMMNDLGYDDEGEGRNVNETEDEEAEKLARSALEKRATEAETAGADARGALEKAQGDLATLAKRAETAEQRLGETTTEFTAYQEQVRLAIDELKRDGVLIAVAKGNDGSGTGAPADDDAPLDPKDPEAAVKAIRKVHRGGGRPLLAGSGNGAR